MPQPLPRPGPAPSSTAASSFGGSPPPRATSGPTPAAPGGRGVVGYVEGLVQEDAREVFFWGGRALLGCGAVLVVVALVTHGVEIMHGLVAALMPIALIIGLFALLASRSDRGSSVMGSMFQTSSSVAHGVVRSGGAGVRGSAGALIRSGSARFGVTIRRFRVKDLLGNVTSCVLVGDTDADFRQGDLVRVEGAKDRRGLVSARRLEVLDAVDRPPRLTIRTTLGLGYRLAQVSDVVAKLCSLAAIAAIIALLAG